MMATMTPGELDWLLKGSGALLALAVAANVFAALYLNIQKIRKGTPPPPPPPPPAPQPFIIAMEEKFVTQETYEKEISDLKTDVHQQIKDMRGYIHTEMHALKEGLQSASFNATKGFNEVKDLVVAQFKELDQKRSVSVAGLYRDQKEMKEKLHAEISNVRDRTVTAETKATSNDQQIHALRAEVGVLRTQGKRGA